MFDESYIQLEVDEIAILLDELNKKVDGSIFDPLETTILAIDIPFYPEHRFLNVADHKTHPPLQRYLVQNKTTKEFVIIDWRYQTIYNLNTSAKIALNDKNVLDYVRFFFEYVKGRHGRFKICESADHISWKDEPPAQVKKSLNDALQPLTLSKDKREKDKAYVINAFMMLKDTLFKTEITVTPQGKVTMGDHDILIEEIPVLDAALGQ